MTTTFPGCTMIATLGGKPELVTLALDALLAAGEAVDEVIVLHPSAAMPRIRAALQTLQGEFAHRRYRGRPCHFQPIALRLGERELPDIRNDSEAEATQRTIRDLIAGQKQQNRKLHLCVAGGRRVMGLLVMASAALLCDHRDRLWHLYGSDAFKAQVKEQALLHAPDGADVRLVPIPLVPWGTYFPALRAIAQTPQEAVAGQMAWLTGANDEQCQAVYDELTERQRDVLEAFARGLRPKEVAEQLVIALATVNSHKSVILEHCRNRWAVDDDECSTTTGC
ncbi:MAG: CRISPR-associated ring nuclease [Caldilineaceae bacterium]